jgi:3-oxoacyl-[acyl-carrier-protein] synthase-1
VDLAVPALTECLEAAEVKDVSHTAMILGIQEPERPGLFQSRRNDILEALQKRTGLRFSSESEVIPTGGASGLVALTRVQELLTANCVECVIVGGVDSYINAETLLWLEHNERLKNRRNPDGMTPGEAACFTAWRNSPPHKKTHTLLASVAIAQEHATITSGEPNFGLGLTQAMRHSLAEARIEPGMVTLEISDISGERYFFKEHLVASARVFTDVQAYLPHWHIATSIGSIGAAGGTCLMGWATISAERGYAPGPFIMCLASSDDGQRAVVLLKTSGGEGGMNA